MSDARPPYRSPTPCPDLSASGQQARGISDGLLITLLVFLLGLTILVWLATGLAGLFAHGSWPNGVSISHTPAAIRHLAAAPKALPVAWPDTPATQLSGYGLFWGLLIGELLALLVLTVFVLGTVSRWRAVRASRRAVSASGAAGVSGSGAAAGPAVGTSGHSAVEAAGPPGRPDPVRDAVPDAASGVTPGPGWAGAAPLTRILYGAAETRIPAAVQAVQDAAGPAMVVTSTPAVWAETKDARAKLGPVLVYDPGHLCDTPARLHWSPTTGCESTEIAAARAIALLAPVRPQARIDAAMADTAETLLSSWLHAAAIDGLPFKQLHRWAQGSGTAHEPVRILRTHPKASSAAAGLLESALTAHPGRRETAQELTVRTLASLSSIHIRETCTPDPTDTRTLESFVREGGTLYVVGEAIEDPRRCPGAMPLLTALVSSVVEHGRRLAARSTDGRLDPPMALVLDDIAAVAPLPRLTELLSTGRDQGLTPLVLLRSREQQRSRWPESVPR